MKEVEKKDVPDVSGGYIDGCIPIPRIDPDYPPNPIGPIGPTYPQIPPPLPEQPLP